MRKEVVFTNAFKKDVKRLKKRGANLEHLLDVIDLLAIGKKLPERYADHALTGNYAGTRECHIAPDWLLIYEISDTRLVLVCNRTGSHSDLF